MKVGSLFSGIGGIELGLERTGKFETEWFVENNPFCQQVLKKHWPKASIYGDITTIDFSKLTRVDMLTGGFPCQDISVAGKKAGIKEGTRSGLWFHYARAIREIRPRLVLIENVSELTRSGLNIVLADLAKEGYDAEWFDLRASDFGAPHKREREFSLLPTITTDSINMRTEKYKQGGRPLTMVLLPTLLASEVEKMPSGSMVRAFRQDLQFSFRKNQERPAQFSLPTIGANEFRGSSTKRYKGSKDFRGSKMSEGLRTSKDEPTYLNPCFAEVVMGFEIGWTELKPAAMPSSQSVQNSSEKE